MICEFHSSLMFKLLYIRLCFVFALFLLTESTVVSIIPTPLSTLYVLKFENHDLLLILENKSMCYFEKIPYAVCFFLVESAIVLKKIVNILPILLLILSGDIELNPGPPLDYSDVVKASKTSKNLIKYLHINCQSIVKKRCGVKKLLDDFHNTIFGFSETWLDSEHDSNLWAFDNSKFTAFRSDRDKNSSRKSRGGGVMLLIPTIFNPKERKDLYNMDKKFDSLWVQVTYKKMSTLIHICYNPSKSTTSDFLDELALSIDSAIVKTSNIVLMGDYNINYFNKNEKESLNSICIPYDLTICNTSEATRQNCQSKTLIDYIISDVVYNKHFIFEAPFKTDHYASVMITKSAVSNKVNPIS